MAKTGRKPRSRDDYVIASITYTIVTLCALTILYPMLNIISVSLSSYQTYIKTPMMFFPTELDFTAYKAVFSSKLLINSYVNTIIITLFGTAFTLLITILYAYPLSRPHMRFKPFFNTFIIITMMFSGGIVPSFLLIRSIGLYDTLASQWLPSILGAYNCILMVNFFRAMPEEMLEASMVDGANDPVTLFKIVLPLSKPILATVALFAAVGFWNNYFSAVIYIRSQTKWPVQLVLREIILAANTAALSSGGNMSEMNTALIPVEQLRYASLIVVMLPIMCVYPFLQKYFASGVMLGAVKG